MESLPEDKNIEELDARLEEEIRKMEEKVGEHRSEQRVLWSCASCRNRHRAISCLAALLIANEDNYSGVRIMSVVHFC